MYPEYGDTKITPKKLVEGRDYKIITIVKGDTLWDLARKYYHNPFMWPKFKKFNDFTDPHWIYPGEKLIVSYVEVEKVIKHLKEEREKARKREEEEKLRQLLLQQQELEKRLRGKHQKELEAIREELEKLKSTQEIIMAEHTKRIIDLSDQLHSLKQQEELLRLSIAELERKLEIGTGELEGNGVVGLADNCIHHEEDSHILRHFLAFGIVCGIILLNSL
jgi:LysM repeat protein